MQTDYAKLTVLCFSISLNVTYDENMVGPIKFISVVKSHRRPVHSQSNLDCDPAPQSEKKILLRLRSNHDRDRDRNRLFTGRYRVQGAVSPVRSFDSAAWARVAAGPQRAQRASAVAVAVAAAVASAVAVRHAWRGAVRGAWCGCRLVVR